MDDLISRQDAIEAVQNRHMMLSKEKALLINDLEKLPSALPEPCEDAVSRKVVCDWIDECQNHADKLYGYEEKALANVKRFIVSLPSVTPKQRTGKWINGYCSECGEHAPFWAMASTYHESNFCPNCGAKMEVNNESN